MQMTKMTRFNEVVQPEELLELFKSEKKAKSDSIRSFFAPEAVMHAIAVQELRAQLDEAEQALRDLGLARVDLVDEQEISACAREPSTQCPESERCTETAGKWRCMRRVCYPGAAKCRLHTKREAIIEKRG
jgi:hypothetical protein